MNLFVRVANCDTYLQLITEFDHFFETLWNSRSN